MLIIRRKAGESLLIGPEVEIEVIDLSPSRVKLGIRAPREVLVLRKEVQLTADENRAAGFGVSADALHALVSRIRRA